MSLLRSCGALGLLFAVGCSGDPSSVAVVPDGIEVSADRRTITVSAGYPTSLFCAKEPGGLDVTVEDDVVVIEATVQDTEGADRCTLECESVVQSIMLSEPLPETVRFEAVSGADQGCSGSSPLVTTAPSTTDVAPCLVHAPPVEFDRQSVAGPPQAGDNADRGQVGAAAVAELSKQLLGSDASRAVQSLQAAGWVVTVVEGSATSTTATPDTLWNRIVVTTCGGRVEGLAFD